MLRTMTFAALAVGLSFATAATAAPPCSNFSGSARTACLNEELARAQQESARIAAQNRRTDQQIQAVCVGRKVVNAGAGVAGGMVAGPGGKAAAKTVSKGSQMVGDAVTGNGGCSDR